MEREFPEGPRIHPPAVLSPRPPDNPREDRYKVVAQWLFRGNGEDEGGTHSCALVGRARFVPTPHGQGLFTDDHTGHAVFDPPIPRIRAGRISFSFKLDASLGKDPAFLTPITILGSTRPGRAEGDCSIRLDPSDGKLCFVQGRGVGARTLRTQKDSWAPDVWYEVNVLWGREGRRILVTWDGGRDDVADGVVFPCFAADAVFPWIAYRAGDSPPVGLTIDWLEIAQA